MDTDQIANHSPERILKVLAATRAELIHEGRKIADGLIEQHGSTNIGQVYPVLAERGVIPDGIDNRWLGALFAGKRYKWTGKFVPGLCLSPGSHSGRLAREWTFA